MTSSLPLQSFLWPALSRLQSLLAVAGPRQGKTVGWLLPLLGQLADRASYSHLAPGPAPLLVVLCPGLEEGGHISSLVEEVARGAGLEVRVLQDTAGLLPLLPTQMINGCEVLVTSPPRLSARLAGAGSGLERCRHLVLEAADWLLELWPGEVSSLLAAWGEQPGGPGQLVALAERWSPALGQLCTGALRKRGGAVLFTSMLEAAVYGEVQILPTFSETEGQKDGEIKDVVEREEGRLVLCCQDTATAGHLERLLLLHGPVVLEEGSSPAQLSQQLEDWRTSSPAPPLLVMDAALELLPLPQGPLAVAGPLTLVHWDLPSSNRKAFSKRFRLVRAAVRNVFRPDAAVMEATVRILLSPENALELRTIVPLLQVTLDVNTILVLRHISHHRRVR